jgi:type IV pilus assembly protein PilN
VIRINLLPKKRSAQTTRTEGQAWLIWILVVMLLEIIGLFAFHSYTNNKLKDQNRKNSELSAQIEESKRVVQKHPEVKAKLEQLRAKEDAIAALQNARTGPTAVLLELARILTPGRGPTVDPDRIDQLRRENPLALFAPNWDPRRLWLTRYTEENRSVRIVGMARDGEDVSEFARRLNLSAFFNEVRLLPGKRTRDAKTGLELVDFELQAKARY